jgi:hypothetical protein
MATSVNIQNPSAREPPNLNLLAASLANEDNDAADSRYSREINRRMLLKLGSWIFIGA